MSNKFIVVTNCTARKKIGAPIVTFNPKGNCLRRIAEDWRITLAMQASKLPAGRLYVGRSILEAKNVSLDIGAPLYIVSAGMGLMKSDQLIPGYNISASGKKTDLTATLTRLGASKADWWNLLTSGNKLNWLLRENCDATVLIALPSEYLDMVLDDLAMPPLQDRSRLRVFTSPSGRKKLERAAGVTALPYDERLESITGYAGTRSDFPQRALKHFVVELNGLSRPIDEAMRSVVASLDCVEYKKPPQRRRLDDEEMRALIRQLWDSVGSNSSNLLRHLRDTELVACEQGRFSRLRRQVQSEFKEVRNYAESTP